MSEVPKIIKEFSKTNAPEERANVGREIWEKRSEHFAAKNELTNRIEDLIKEAEAKLKRAEEVVLEIREIEAEVSEKQSNIFGRFVSFFRLKELEESLAIKKIDQQNILAEYAEIQEILSELELQKLDKSILNEAREQLASFYANQEEAWEKYEGEREIRDVANIMGNHNVVFLHSIKSDFIPGENSLLQKDTPWQKKLDIALAISPVLSTSTIREGDTRENMWGGMGVILKGGSVQRAFSGDAGTIAQGKNKRVILDQATMPIGGEIEQALNKSSDQYNEFVVEEPQIAGYYVCIDQRTGVRSHDTDSADNIRASVERLNMPLYLIEAGLVYEAVYVPASIDQSQTPPRQISSYFVKGKKVEIQDIIDNNFVFSDQDKTTLKDNLFKNSPFRIKTPEVDLVDTRFCAMQFYHESKVIDSSSEQGLEGEFTELKRLIHQQGSYFYPAIKSNVEIKVLRQAFGVAWDAYYVLIDGTKYRVMKNKLTAELNIVSEEVYILQHSRSLSGGYMTMHGGTEKLEGETKDNNDYIHRITDLVKELQVGNTDRDKLRLQKIAFYLFGFAEAARASDDQIIADQAAELAKSILSEKDYQELVERRFDQEGNFLITEDDLN